MTEPASAAGPATIVLATRNPGKLAELRRILAAAGVSAAVTDLEDVPGMPEVAETGRSFTENALLKAWALAAFIGLPAVADDSGLCVDALNGMPGVLSARWSGSHGDDEANLRLLLAQLSDVPPNRRAASPHIRGEIARRRALPLEIAVAARPRAKSRRRHDPDPGRDPRHGRRDDHRTALRGARHRAVDRGDAADVPPRPP